MNTNTSIVTQLEQYHSIAKVFAESGLFEDCRQQAQAFVKICAGHELGLPPFTAMNSFHIIRGKVCLTANTIAARIKSSGKYDYRVTHKDAKKCIVQFYEKGDLIHTEMWDEVRAKAAGVGAANHMFAKYPDAMLFSRCISAGARVACPDIIGAYYTAEEMGADVNEDGEVIVGVSMTPSPEKIVASNEVIDASPAESGKASEDERKTLRELGKKYKALKNVDSDPLLLRARAALTNGSKALVTEAIQLLKEVPFID